MLSPSRIFALFLALALTASPGWLAGQTQRPRAVTRRTAAHARKVDPPPQPDPVPQPPPPPPTPEQMPPQPPQVSYLNGQLTIISQNSTMADILAAVRNRTGAAIDVPAGSGMERVAGRMGPGPAREVLAQLLNGSRFDYVMIASPNNPRGVERVILTQRTGGESTSAPVMANNQVQNPPAPQPQVMPEQAEAPPDSGDDGEAPVAEEQPNPDEGTPE